VRAASTLQTISVGRAHNIIPFIVVQDVSQLQILYSKAEADAILNMTGNLLCGQTGGDTARWVSERFPPIVQHKTTVSTNSTDTSRSESEQTMPAITPATLATLSSGEFVGILADDPGNEMEFKAFHAKIIKKNTKEKLLDLPVVREIAPGELEENFRRVKAEVRELVESEIKRMMRDPKLKGTLLKG
jgi:type IV secretory pathway TraG/TraD family ATPase VirD4